MLPFNERSTSMTVSVQIPLPRSTGPERTTVPMTISGVFATSCSSVGITIVVAWTVEAAAIVKTHVSQYTRKCFTMGSLQFVQGFRAPARFGLKWNSRLDRVSMGSDVVGV